MAEKNSATYTAPPTVQRFMKDDTSEVRLLMGPYGSGKTTANLMELIRRACNEHPTAQGVRQTRFAVIRNTSGQLRQTVLPEIEKWLKPAFHYKVTDSTLNFDFKLPDGTTVQSSWMLIPLDEPRDQERLLSLNLTGAWISEFRQVPLEIMDPLLGRCGRFKPLGLSRNAWYGVIAESNPPDEESEWYMKMEINRPSTWTVYKQPSGLSPEAENLENLRPGYYQSLVESSTADWADVHVRCQYGKSLSGQAVFRSSFRADFHVTQNPLKLTDGYPIMIGQDFGRTPAALLTQVDVRGRLMVLGEQTSTDMGIEQFTQTLLKPTLARQFPGAPVFMVADPAGRQKSQINEESPFDALQRLGFRAYPAPSNDIDTRLRAVEQLFLRNVDGGPAILISGPACPILVRALKFDYRYRRKQTGDLEDKPEKSHPASDIADCLQYAALGANGNYTAQVIAENRPRPRRAGMPVRAWT
jgi:hypothetical protein